MAYLIALTILVAPAYAWRFLFFGIPANGLMIWIIFVWVAFLVWLISQNKLKSFFVFLRNQNKILTSFIIIFFIAGLLSLFVGGLSLDKIGQFLVLFVQPISIYFIVRYIFDQQPKSKELIVKTFYFFVAVCGAYALLQYFTLIGLPQGWWGNSQEPKRAIAFFLHPNFYALFITPILAFLIPDMVPRIQVLFQKRLGIIYIFAWVLGSVGLLMSLSRGGWLGLLVATAIFVIISANKKYLLTSVIALLIIAGVVYAIPNLRYRVLLPFYGEKSSVARLSLWRTGSEMIKDSPILGKGLLGFSNNWELYNRDPGLGKYPAPHNIFLNFWIDTGLLGLLSFLAICFFAFGKALKRNRSALVLGVGLFIIGLIIHGLIDTPYLKNDLALIFWLVLALL